jgi:hypothetical protein
MGDRRKCQTYTASPAEPGGLPVMLARWGRRPPTAFGSTAGLRVKLPATANPVGIFAQPAPQRPESESADGVSVTG